MKLFRGEHDRVESELRAARPVPREEFVTNLTAEIRARSHRTAGRPRFALGFATVVVMATLFGTFGGFGYAASAVSQAVKTVVPASKPAAPTPAANPSHDEYGKKCGHDDGSAGPKKPNQTPCPPQAGPKH
jgi:hypothetical protein